MHLRLLTGHCAHPQEAEEGETGQGQGPGCFYRPGLETERTSPAHVSVTRFGRMASPGCKECWKMLSNRASKRERARARRRAGQPLRTMEALQGARPGEGYPPANVPNQELALAWTPPLDLSCHVARLPGFRVPFPCAMNKGPRGCFVGFCLFQRLDSGPWATKPCGPRTQAPIL